VSSSATNGTVHTSSVSIDRVCATGVSICESSGKMKNEKPVTVMSTPLRLSGRRRQAISPAAANEPPIMR